MKFKRNKRPIRRPSEALGDRIGLNVVPKNEETEDFLFAHRESLAYERHGMVWRRHADGSLECLGPFNKAWMEVGR